MVQFVENISHIIESDELLSSLNNGRTEDLYIQDENGNLAEHCKGQAFPERVYAAGYPDPICSGRMFYGGLDYPAEWIYKLDKYFGTICIRCIINETQPGMIVPPHYDVPTEGREEKLLKLGTIEAYHIHIGEPKEGQLIMLEKQALHLQENGNCYKWDDYLNWHSAANVSYDPKYVLLYKGLRPFTPFAYSYNFTEDDDNVQIVLEDGTCI